jgi:hypothetical protein
VGKTKRGKGTKKLRAVAADSADGLPISIHNVTSAASPHHEVTTLAEDTVPTKKCFLTDEKPARLIGEDRAYDSDPLDYQQQQQQQLATKQGIELIAPHRYNRRAPDTQDGLPLRRYKRRWKVEERLLLFAWLQNFRRIQVRHDYYAQNFLDLFCLAV